MTRLTISKCSDWLGGKGIINILTKNYNVPWKDKVDGSILDLDYYGNHSGNKIISPLVEQLIDNTGLSDVNMNKLAQLIFSKYGYNWTKLWDATQLEYNPIHNYDGDEEEILTVKETGTDSVVGQGGGQSKTYGFNSINAVDADESSTDSSNTETKDLQTETTRKFKKGGNLGVTTTQQMMTSEYEYRINYEFFIAVFKDVDKILVIESYGDVKIRPCDVIIQSSYTLPIATENTLGGIKVGDNLTITSDGRLSATGGGGTGGVESVNGKVGKVVLNADDVGAYSQSNQPPYPVTKVNNKTGNVTITASDVGAYSESNQPPYPVTKVNNKTGDITLNASEIYLSNSDSVESAIGDINTNISALNSNFTNYLDNIPLKINSNMSGQATASLYLTEQQKSRIVKSGAILVLSTNGSIIKQIFFIGGREDYLEYINVASLYGGGCSVTYDNSVLTIENPNESWGGIALTIF